MAHLRIAVDVRNPGRRQIEVALEADREAWPAPAAQVVAIAGDALTHLELSLPVWTPGSYLVREYSRHLSMPVAEDPDTGTRLRCEKTSKNRFRVSIPVGARRVSVRYRVYAHELSVRTADLTADHAYWNHACVLLWPVDAVGLVADVEVRLPSKWVLTCALLPDLVSQPTAAEQEVADRRVRLPSASFDELVDSPCLAGAVSVAPFAVDGIHHAIVLDGLETVRPPESLVADFAAIVRAVAKVFGGSLPYPRYLFQSLFAADGHGGLEHANSTTLLGARTAMRSEKGYREFLALAAHELFHAWNGKRLRPIEFWRYDYERENYTSLLWLIEGWTAYYDDLLCVRAGLMSVADYLATLATTCNAMLQGPGRHHLSLADSSFDAWIRLYRPDENTRNSSQNYYGNGAVAALCLDLHLRRETGGRRSLDDVLGYLYANTFGKDRGYSSTDVLAALEAVGGGALVASLRSWTEGPFDPDLVALFSIVGVRVAMREAGRPALGLTFEPGSTTVATVAYDSAAEAAGLMPGDEILALEGLRVDSARWPDVLGAVASVERPLRILLTRRGAVRTEVATPRPSPGTLALEVDEAASPEQVALREQWLVGARRANQPLLTKLV